MSVGDLFTMQPLPDDQEQMIMSITATGQTSMALLYAMIVAVCT